MMNILEQLLVDHEVRLRVQEQVVSDIRETLHRLDDRMDAQFKWTIGILVTFLVTVILHLIKLV